MDEAIAAARKKYDEARNKLGKLGCASARAQLQGQEDRYFEAALALSKVDPTFVMPRRIRYGRKAR